MNISDLYGGGLGVASTGETVNPVSQTPQQKDTAQAVAQNKPIKNSYGVIAILAIIGVLVGAKFTLEKR